MTVDLLAATFWPEGTLLGCRPAHPDGADPAGDEIVPADEADRAARTEGFWSAMVRHLWRPTDAAALP